MKNEYYTLHNNGSFEKLNKSDLLQNGKGKKKKGISVLMSKEYFMPIFNLSLLILLGLTLTVILSLHINGNFNYQLSHLIQVMKNSFYFLSCVVRTLILLFDQMKIS